MGDFMWQSGEVIRWRGFLINALEFGLYFKKSENRNAHEYTYLIMSSLPKYLECLLTSVFKCILAKIKSSFATGTEGSI